MNSTETSLTTIKQLKREIAELKKAKQQLEYIINTLPVHIYWLDKNNIFLGCNTQQAKELLQVEASIHEHKRTKDLYRIPGKFTNTARKIYKAVGITRSENATVYITCSNQR